jgi:hypothetical protein
VPLISLVIIFKADNMKLLQYFSYLALLGLTGCAVVPYPAGDYYNYNNYSYQPAAVEVAPVVVAPAYAIPPPVYFGLGINYSNRGWGRHGYGYGRSGYRGYRHSR